MVYTRFIFSVYTLIRFFSFYIKLYIAIFKLYIPSQQIHITFPLEMLDQFKINKFFFF